MITGSYASKHNSKRVQSGLLLLPTTSQDVESFTHLLSSVYLVCGCGIQCNVQVLKEG